MCIRSETRVKIRTEAAARILKALNEGSTLMDHTRWRGHPTQERLQGSV